MPNVLIIGYGSIGKRHAQVIQEYFANSSIDLISSQNLPNAYPSLQSLPNINAYDYYIISSPTSKHYQDLTILDHCLTNKLILVEKPLFAKKETFIPSKKNQIYVGYVLRFHPLLQKLHDILQNTPPYFVEISCGSYLPNWRPNIDYRKNYGASKKLGGGVLLDLSHEIDYATWLFGDFKSINGFNSHISELEIETDDIANYIITTSKGVHISLILNYFSKKTTRIIVVHTQQCTYHLNLVKNELHIYDQNSSQQMEQISLKRNDLFFAMHQNMLQSSTKKLPNINEALKLTQTISRMQNI